MGVVITDISALEAYRHDSGFSVALPSRHSFGKRASLALMRPRAVEFAELSSRGFGFLSAPVHVMVSRKEMRFQTDGVVWHVCSSELPQRAVREVAHDIFLVSPEIALLHCSLRKDVRELILLGFELCGAYRLGEGDSFRKADRFTSPSALARFAQVHSKARGSALLCRAAKYVVAGSASPMESALAMLLSAPCALGGYGLPAPRMNERIDMPSKSVLSQSKRYYVADLYWPRARFAIEYDSDCWHTGSDRIAADAVRRNALLHVGVRVLTVGRQQIASVSKMDDIAKIVARALGHPLRIRVKGWGERNRELREIVFPWGKDADRNCFWC